MGSYFHIIRRLLAIATDQAGNVAIAGLTCSPDFPTPPSAPFEAGPIAYSAFVSVLNPRGDGFVFSTLVNDIFVYATAFDATSNVFLAGYAKAGPATYNYVPIAARLVPCGSRFLFERTLGGAGSYIRDFGFAVAVNRAVAPIPAAQRTSVKIVAESGVLGAYPLARPVAAASVSFGDIVGEVLNVSTLPGFVTGIFQIQVRIPESAPANDRTSTRISGAGGAAAGPSVARR